MREMISIKIFTAIKRIKGNFMNNIITNLMILDKLNKFLERQILPKFTQG